MTGLGDRHPAPARRTPLRAEIAPPQTPIQAGEVQREGSMLVGSFHLPSVSLRELKYHVGRRTITVWSRKEGHEFQTILVLPTWVRSESFLLAHKNGVFEFHLEVAAEPPVA